MSFSGFSASRKSIWAMTTEAWWSSIVSPRKITLSLSRREKMSYARSPRLVCSTTMGINMFVTPRPPHRTAGTSTRALFYEARKYFVHRPLTPEDGPHPFEPAALGQITPQFGERYADAAPLVPPPGGNLGVRDLDAEPVCKRVQENLAPPAVLDPLMHILLELFPVDLGPFGVDAAAGQRLGELNQLAAGLPPPPFPPQGKHPPT